MTNVINIPAPTFRAALADASAPAVNVSYTGAEYIVSLIDGQAVARLSTQRDPSAPRKFKTLDGAAAALRTEILTDELRWIPVSLSL
jgi:hypothetical protein